MRIVGTCLAIGFCMFLLTTLVTNLTELGDGISALVSLPLASLVGYWCWRVTLGAHLGPVAWMVTGSLVTGAAALVFSLGAIFLFAPGANQGPMLAIFIIGPLGVVLGAIAGYVVWRWQGKG